MKEEYWNILAARNARNAAPESPGYTTTFLKTTRRNSGSARD
jgi:hypothetical protein